MDLKYKLVLFDLDGTLLDSAPALIKSTNRLLDYYQQPVRDSASLRACVSLGAVGLIKHVFDPNNLPDTIESMRTLFLDFYKQDMLHDLALFDGISDLLKNLEDRDVLWGIVTNKYRYFTEPILSELNLHKRVGVLKCGDDLEKAKPSPDLLLAACKDLQIQVQDAVYIGDHQRDIEAGNSAGMCTIAVSYGYTSDDESIENWQADYNVHGVSELTSTLLGATVDC